MIIPLLLIFIFIGLPKIAFGIYVIFALIWLLAPPKDK